MKTTLIETDDLDSENSYYLYEVENEDKSYYISTSDEEIKKNNGEIDFNNHYNMLKREDFTDRQWEIAKYLFTFLWDSSNGTNTCAEPDIYEEDGFTREEMEEFVEWFNEKQPNEVLDFYYEDNDGVEIFWAYFSCFDMNSCNPWEVMETEGKRYLVVFDDKRLDGSYLVSCGDDDVKARQYRDRHNANKEFVKKYGRVHVEVETITRKVIY